jgi:nitroreductase
MTVEDAIRLRRSIRRYGADKPARELIEKLLEMAVYAPSASNKQPWRFFVVDERTTILRMAAAVQEAVERIARHIEARFGDAFRAYGDSTRA